VSDQYAGNLAQVVGLILVLFAKSGPTLKAKDVAVPSSAVAVVVNQVILILVALATDLHKL